MVLAGSKINQGCNDYKERSGNACDSNDFSSRSRKDRPMEVWEVCERIYSSKAAGNDEIFTGGSS
ncbi:3570a999-3a71-4d56-8fd2-40eb6d20c3b6 [Sclerotinia trifoliorum]|uniref:3570a999-3a71-4d56-8fd2-40eb6d20c3b6 n=1 Tax=Sclerotinia trifoliorum TaxID=28548 RepID=A0A8H2VLZ4_9HELO|nr:3570a999-3a71-4d56-8fd2-40eb6d20c3b6 [Sclerotinia trifoliorum]